MTKHDLIESLTTQGEGIAEELRANFGENALRVPDIAPNMGGVALCSCCGKPEDEAPHKHALDDEQPDLQEEASRRQIMWETVLQREAANLGVDGNKEALEQIEDGTLYGIILSDMKGRPTQFAMPAMLVRHDGSAPKLLGLRGHTFDYSAGELDKLPALDELALGLLREGKDMLHPVVGSQKEHVDGMAAGATLGHSTQIIRALSDSKAQYQLTRNVHATHDVVANNPDNSKGVAQYLTDATDDKFGTLAIRSGESVFDPRFAVQPVSALPNTMTLVKVEQSALPKTNIVVALGVMSANQRSGGNAALDRLKQGVESLR